MSFPNNLDMRPAFEAGDKKFLEWVEKLGLDAGQKVHDCLFSKEQHWDNHGNPIGEFKEALRAVNIHQAALAEANGEDTIMSKKPNPMDNFLERAGSTERDQGYVRPGVNAPREFGEATGCAGRDMIAVGHTHFTPTEVHVQDLGVAGAAIANDALRQVMEDKKRLVEEKRKLELRVKELEASITVACAYAAAMDSPDLKEVVRILDRRGER